MKRFWLLKGLRFALAALAAAAAFGYLVMALWNAVVPAVAGLHPISWLQALALLVLSRILFGGLRSHGGWHWRHRLRARWDEMSPAERARFGEFAGRGGRCGQAAPREPDAAG